MGFFMNIDGECSVCGYNGESEEIQRDVEGRLVFQICPNCGSTYSTSYHKKSGGSTTTLESPIDDLSTCGLGRIVVGAILFGIGCWEGLSKSGSLVGSVGAGCLIWGWIRRKFKMEHADHVKSIYPYWKRE